jgi:hypothetical protein
MSGSPDRFVFTLMNACWGASIGAALALLVHGVDAWSGDQPSRALLIDGALVVFGIGFLLAAVVRGRRLTVGGALTVVGSAAGLYLAWTLAVSAPAWALVWTAAACAGLVTGLRWPLAETSER